MSADNGIYIAKFPDGYRFAYYLSIDNIDFYPEGSKQRKKELKKCFGNCEPIADEKTAIDEAFKLYDEICHDGSFIEHGVSLIGEYEQF